MKKGTKIALWAGGAGIVGFILYSVYQTQQANAAASASAASASSLPYSPDTPVDTIGSEDYEQIMSELSGVSSQYAPEDDSSTYLPTNIVATSPQTPQPVGVSAIPPVLIATGLNISQSQGGPVPVIATPRLPSYQAE